MGCGLDITLALDEVIHTQNSKLLFVIKFLKVLQRTLYRFSYILSMVGWDGGLRGVLSYTLFLLSVKTIYSWLNEDGLMEICSQ